MLVKVAGFATVNPPVIVVVPKVPNPVVVILSLSKLIVPSESVIWPFVNVRFPILEPDALSMIPVKVPIPLTVTFPKEPIPLAVMCLICVKSLLLNVIKLAEVL